MTVKLTRAALETMDERDELRTFRDRFHLPDGLIYLDGNSLGAMPKAASERVRHVVDVEWAQGLIRSWNQYGWIDLQQRIGAKIGRLIGADEGETIVADSTSVNLFKMLAAALKLRPGRRVILSEPANFPTDLYMAEGLIALLGGDHELVLAEPDEIESAIDEDVAVVMLTHVNYRTGRMYDMAKVTERAHRAGALTVWDLAHSAGAVPLHLAAAGADFAVGCGYKYLNGGPGAPAFLYVARRHQDTVAVPLTGWFGHADPFAFEPSYRPASGIARALVGTPPLISLSALEVGVDLMLEASMSALRAKSVRQAEIFAALIEQEVAGLGFEIVSPREADRRGSQVCLSHASAWPIMQSLIARGVIGDFRAPDVLRFGFTPLYLGYTELWDAVAALRHIMESDEWKQPAHHARLKVT
ncbi:kynureninase [Parvibaculum sp.]|uniref:kynureninase n=1 Tax=Parvibaculum sp. TaxID=2024848 RepID=UPI002CA97404|nr:kynureninase [Parvibaculum sp.]HUD51079.1 kynureninase [Parvibaculum sp.]